MCVVAGWGLGVMCGRNVGVGVNVCGRMVVGNVSVCGWWWLEGGGGGDVFGCRGKEVILHKFYATIYFLSGVVLCVRFREIYGSTVCCAHYTVCASGGVGLRRRRPQAASASGGVGLRRRRPQAASASGGVGLRRRRPRAASAFLKFQCTYILLSFFSWLVKTPDVTTQYMQVQVVATHNR